MDLLAVVLILMIIAGIFYWYVAKMRTDERKRKSMEIHFKDLIALIFKIGNKPTNEQLLEYAEMLPHFYINSSTATVNLINERLELYEKAISRFVSAADMDDQLTRLIAQLRNEYGRTDVPSSDSTLKAIHIPSVYSAGNVDLSKDIEI